jgi:uncharacterized protein
VRPTRAILIAVIVAIFVFGRGLAGLVLDYQWWGEVGQVDTWWRLWLYRWVPLLVAWLVLFVTIWWAHARGMKYAGTGLAQQLGYARLATLAIAVLSFVLASATLDGWTTARFLGSPNAVGTGWTDPVFGQPLAFYFFRLPFYQMLAQFIGVGAFVAAAAYYLAARLWQLRLRMPDLWQQGQVEWSDVTSLGKLESHFFKFVAALALVSLAVIFWLGRYEMLFSSHGELMTGIDYVQQNASLPLQTAKAIAAVLAAVLVMLGRQKLALACALVLVVAAIVPAVVGSLYVRPNELALERPYLERHIEATRAAYGLDQRTTETEFAARKEGKIDFAANRVMLDNVRLWDWQAFHDTLSQSQPLRPYAYADTDVDRYRIGGQMRQVLLAPRELDINQLGTARDRWVISHTIYTHGYGLALAESNRISSTGLPELLIRNAPVEVAAQGLQLTRPEIYYGEASHDPVFVRTSQPEFNYPSGSEDVSTRYEGRGGFPIASMPLRFAAAVAEGDWNIVLSDALNGESRMMMRRAVRPRLEALAPFLTWDADPYMVIDDGGRLMWIADGYTMSERHPYARKLSAGNDTFNYIRNAVKATVDAYNGTVTLYINDANDPLIQAYASIFPALFTPIAQMPADVRQHLRAPEFLFRTQAEIYRTYHMRNPESFYNRADSWDLATFTAGQAGSPETVDPSYLMATLPGETEPEFLLTVPFTPRNKQNLIGLMAARCDGEHLGELVFLQLPKQEIIPGPLQIEALLNQDNVISKDLSLWNQQGSQVLRGQVMVLPISNTFLFVAPIYIQAAQARMPQLEKIVLAAGNDLVYADSYPQALEMLAARQRGGAALAPAATPTQTSTSAPSSNATGPDSRIVTIRQHLERYRSLSGEGKLSEAGRELEAIESLVGSR